MATAIDTNGDYEHMKIEELPTNDEFSEYDWREVFSGEKGYRGEAILWHSTEPGKTADPITLGDVAKVVSFQASSPEGYGSVDLTATVRLNDGRFAIVEAWADTSGWDCQSGVTWKVGRESEDLAEVERLGKSETWRA